MLQKTFQILVSALRWLLGILELDRSSLLERAQRSKTLQSCSALRRQGQTYTSEQRYLAIQLEQFYMKTPKRSAIGDSTVTYVGEKVLGEQGFANWSSHESWVDYINRPGGVSGYVFSKIFGNNR